MKTLDAALLRLLRAASAPVPLSELADQLKTTLPVLQVRLAGLREAGFLIESRPEEGCALVSSPDRLIADDLAARLTDCELVRDILVFEETDSTNNRVSTLGRSGAAAGIIVFAERQTAGRGRFGRRWESASHLGLWFSLLLRPELPVALWTRLTTWAAVGIAAAVDQFSGDRAAIKWPNDIFLRGRKVAGILIETGCADPQRPFAVIGIGINVNHREADFPAELMASATSLREITGRAIDRSELAVAALHELNTRLPLVTRSFDRLIAEAEQRSALLGTWIQARQGEQTFEGIADSLDHDGCLLLRGIGGTLFRVTAAEVTLSTAPAGS